MDTEIVISVHFLLYFKYINSESMLRWGEWVYLAEREERAQNLGLSSPVNGLPHIERTTGCGLREVHPAPSDANGTRTLLWDLKESLYVGPISAEPLNTTLVFKPIKMNIMEDHVQEASMEKFDMCWKLGACYLNSKELLSLVVVEGLWNQGFVAIAAVRSTIVVSIEVYTKPELSTNSRKFFHQRLNGTPVLKVPEECSRNETRVVMHGTTHFDLETTVMFLAVVVVYIPKDRYYQEAKRKVHLGPEARDPGQFMRKSRTVAVQDRLIELVRRVVLPLIFFQLWHLIPQMNFNNSHLTMDSSIILSTQGADWKSETGPFNLDHIAKILDIVVLSTVSDQQTISRGVVADVDCFSSFSKTIIACHLSQFRKAQDFLALLDALCNWSYVKQLFSKSERSSHLCRMIVDIVITELLRCMVLISCVSEGKEPFVRSKNFNLYVMDEAVSITFSYFSSSSTESVQESADFSSSSTESVQESAVSYLSRFAKSISLVMRWKLSVHLRFFACLTSKLEKSKQSP
ncbi:hypothetical protein LINPERHAP1_LOCUS40147 [Linum perenne]